jgi:hypothetical protein
MIPIKVVTRDSSVYGLGDDLGGDNDACLYNGLTSAQVELKLAKVIGARISLLR